MQVARCRTLLLYYLLSTTEQTVSSIANLRMAFVIEHYKIYTHWNITVLSLEYHSSRFVDSF